MRNINDFREEGRFQMMVENWVESQNVKREPGDISDHRSTTNVLLKAE